MAVRNRIERTGIDGDNLFQEPSKGRMCVGLILFWTAQRRQCEFADLRRENCATKESPWNDGNGPLSPEQPDLANLQ